MKLSLFTSFVIYFDTKDRHKRDGFNCHLISDNNRIGRVCNVCRCFIVDTYIYYVLCMGDQYVMLGFPVLLEDFVYFRCSRRSKQLEYFILQLFVLRLYLAIQFCKNVLKKPCE